MKQLQIIPLLEPADYQAGSQDLDSINMGLLSKVIVLIQLGAITGNDAVFKLYSGATAGAKTTEIGFKYRKSGADSGNASADVFGARTAIAAGATGLTLGTASDWDHRTIEIEVLADQLGAESHDWLTVETDDGSASALFMSAIAIGFPRYDGETHTTAL
jgi:hypothetical protein